MYWFIKVLKNYAQFRGRARRKEYWMFFLISVIIIFLVGIVLAILGADERTIDLISNLIGLSIMIPSLAVAVRRMHDTGRSGYWILFPIVNYVLLCFDSQPHDNEYGANPKSDLSDAQA